MNRIVKILMQRDGMSLEDATELYNDTKAEIENAIAVGDSELVEEILADNLMLELDYVMDLIDLV